MVLGALWTWIGDNEKQIKLVFALVAGVYAFYQYNAHVEATRVERVLSYSTQAHEGEVSKAMQELQAFYSGESYSQWVSTTTAATYNKSLFEELQRRALNSRVYHLLGFYGSLASCVEAGLCEKDVACQIFFEEIQGFRENYRAHLDLWEKELGDRSVRDIHVFAQKSCKATFTAYCASLNNRSAYCTSKA